MKVAPLFTAAGGLKLVTTAQEIGERTNKLQKVIKAIFNVFFICAYSPLGLESLAKSWPIISTENKYAHTPTLAHLSVLSVLLPFLVLLWSSLQKYYTAPSFEALNNLTLNSYRTVLDMQWQRDRFVRHIQASAQTGKPLVVHTRSASEDTLALLSAHMDRKVGGVLHCFTESLAVAEAAMEMGFYISFSGIVTFKNAEELRDAARICPDDRLLIETDSPFLAPVPHRGKQNQPALVAVVGTAIAKLRNVSAEDLAALTSRNALSAFPRIAAP